MMCHSLQCCRFHLPNQHASIPVSLFFNSSYNCPDFIMDHPYMTALTRQGWPPFTIGVQSINDVPFGRGFKPESDKNYGPAYVISPKWWEGGCGPIQSTKSDIIYEQPSLFIHFWLNPLKSEITKWMIPELQTSFDREGLKHFEMCCTVVWLFSAMFQFGNFPLLRLCYCW